MDDRAVSEVVGFVLAFSLVLTTITFVYVGGFAQLENARDNEQTTNAERAFDVLANNLEEIARHEAPSRATEIKLSDSEIRIGDNERRQVEVRSNGTAAVAKPRPVVYESDGESEIVYELGAVFREERDGVVMLREPDFVFDGERTAVRYIEPRGGSHSVAGSKTILVRAERTHSRRLLSESDPGTAWFNLTTAPSRADAWERYLESEFDGLPAGSCTRTQIAPNAERFECSFEPDRLHVARTRLLVTLE